MNKIIIECRTLVDKYKLNRKKIEKQLENMEITKGAENFVIGYKENSKYTLIGEIRPNNLIVLTNIEKAIDFQKMDNSDLFNLK